jgi:hypothetical protein
MSWFGFSGSALAEDVVPVLPRLGSLFPVPGDDEAPPKEPESADGPAGAGVDATSLSARTSSEDMVGEGALAKGQSRLATTRAASADAGTTMRRSEVRDLRGSRRAT